MGNIFRTVTIKMIVLNTAAILALALTVIYDGIISSIIYPDSYIVYPSLIFIFHVLISIACLGYSIFELSKKAASVYKRAALAFFAIYTVYNLAMVLYAVLFVSAGIRSSLLDSIMILPAYFICLSFMCYLLWFTYINIKPKWAGFGVMGTTICIAMILGYWLHQETGFAGSRKAFLNYIGLMYCLVPVLFTPLYLAFFFRKKLTDCYKDFKDTRIVHIYYWYFLISFWVIAFLFVLDIAFNSN